MVERVHDSVRGHGGSRCTAKTSGECCRPRAGNGAGNDKDALGLPPSVAVSCARRATPHLRRLSDPASRLCGRYKDSSLLTQQLHARSHTRICALSIHGLLCTWVAVVMVWLQELQQCTGGHDS